MPGDSSQIENAGTHFCSIAASISDQVHRPWQLQEDDEVAAAGGDNTAAATTKELDMLRVVAPGGHLG